MSIEAQEKVCTEAMTKDGYTPIPALKDEGKSGKDMNRPAMRELIRLVNEKEVQAVYVVHSDRIGRNVKDYLVFRELLREKNVTLECVYQPMLDDSASGRTMDTMMMAFSEMQRLITAEKVKGVMTEIVKAGYFPTYPPPGYLNSKNRDTSVGRIGRNILIVDPVAGPLITETFHRYSRGNVNIYELADIMYAKGLRNRQKKRVQANRMYAMLRNRIYLGEVHWGGMVVKEGKHPPLIDEDTFNRVQTLIEEKNHRACRRRKYFWLLSGFVVCPDHGKRFTAEWHLNKKIAYYHCSNRRGCGKYVEQTALENMVADKFRDLEFSDDFIDLVITEARRIFMERRKKYDSRRQGLVNRRTALEGKRKVAEEKLFADTITDEDFTRIRKEIQEDMSHIDDELAELEDQRGTNVDIAQEVLLLTRDIYRAYKKASPTLKRQYLSFFWERFEVKNQVILSSHPTPLFDALLKLEAAYYRHLENTKPQETQENRGLILSNVLSAHLDSNQEPMA